MVFLGTSFFSGENTLYSPVITSGLINSIQIFDGTYNHVYLSSDTSMTVNNLGDEWNFDTKLNASFDNDSFDAGNSGFSLKNTDHVVIRRREVGQMNWMVIHTQEVNTIADFNVHFIDKYARSGVEYEYSVSSFVNGVENSYIINNVYSEFDGYFIADKDYLYGTIYNVDGCNTTRNTSVQTHQILNSKYMHTASNSEENYDSGSISGVFIKIDEDGNSLSTEALSYRNSIKDRLMSKKPLILKTYDGRIWMIKPTGKVNDNMDGHPAMRKLTFEWNEVGDVNDLKSLYFNGFSDVGLEWW